MDGRKMSIDGGCMDPSEDNSIGPHETAECADVTTERTLVILKPEAIEKYIVGSVLKYFDDANFKPIAMYQRKGSEYIFREHYKDVIARVGSEIGNDIIARMTRGDCIFIVYQGEDAIAKCREIIGATNPAVAATGTIRRVYGNTVQYNVVHASDSPESAEREIRLWFPELMTRPTDSDQRSFGIYYTGC